MLNALLWIWRVLKGDLTQNPAAPTLNSGINCEYNGGKLLLMQICIMSVRYYLR